MDARVLIADSSVDNGATGMTTGKCVAFAQQGAWQYAGVETGRFVLYIFLRPGADVRSECWVGNTMHSASPAAAGDCDTTCAGNNTEVCGGGNRIQIYRDFTWFDPSFTQLIDAIEQYNISVDTALSAIADYRSTVVAIEEFLQDQPGGSRKRSNTQTLVQLQSRLRTNDQTRRLAQQSLGKSMV